uniref:Uncharacterized protein n=1 Tax=Ascaris lumbricoides TaxID=6252 RepID=A0A0M3I4U1_ASCLU
MRSSLLISSPHKKIYSRQITNSKSDDSNISWTWRGSHRKYAHLNLSAIRAS